jgi:hypothetical protein
VLSDRRNHLSALRGCEAISESLQLEREKLATLSEAEAQNLREMVRRRRSKAV